MYGQTGLRVSVIGKLSGATAMTHDGNDFKCGVTDSGRHGGFSISGTVDLL